MKEIKTFVSVDKRQVYAFIKTCRYYEIDYRSLDMGHESSYITYEVTVTYPGQLFYIGMTFQLAIDDKLFAKIP